MKLQDDTGRTREATLTTNHAASSYGRPVLVVDGQAYGPVDLALNGLRVVAADPAEAERLRWAGFCAADIEETTPKG